MIKYSIFIIFGIILYLLFNLHEKFEAVGECNCRDSDDQPIYDRENCLNVFDMNEFANVIPRLDSNGLPCVYTQPLKFMHDNVMVPQRVCERGDTNLRCMVQYYNSIGGSCQINTLFLYYLFIGFPLRREDIEWLNRFNFNLANPDIILMVHNYLLNRSIMRSTLYDLRLNPNDINFVHITKESLRLHNLYQIGINFVVKPNDRYKPLNLYHTILIYISSVEETNRYKPNSFPYSGSTRRCIWLIDGCNRYFKLANFTVEGKSEQNLAPSIIWIYIQNKLESKNYDMPTHTDIFMKDFHSGNFFISSVEILQIGTLNEGEDIPELGETGFIDKLCNPDNPDNPDLDHCNNFSTELEPLTCKTLSDVESRCVLVDNEYQYCDDTSLYCNNDDFACIVDNDYGDFEQSFYRSQLRMDQVEIDSDIAKSNPKCLPTGKLNRPCKRYKYPLLSRCNDGLVCVNSIGQDSLGNPKLPTCRPNTLLNCAASFTGTSI